MSQPQYPVPMTPVSWGELLDKITILEIKSVKLTAAAQLANVRKELGMLQKTAAPVAGILAIGELHAKLRSVNEALWDVEDKIRDKERAKMFDAEFIDLARSVYRLNDQRAAFKKDINNELKSEISEEKSYAAY